MSAVRNVAIVGGLVLAFFASCLAFALWLEARYGRDATDGR
jgi:hypothetical protein